MRKIDAGFIVVIALGIVGFTVAGISGGLSGKKPRPAPPASSAASAIAVDQAALRAGAEAAGPSAKGVKNVGFRSSPETPKLGPSDSVGPDGSISYTNNPYGGGNGPGKDDVSDAGSLPDVEEGAPVGDIAVVDSLSLIPVGQGFDMYPDRKNYYGVPEIDEVGVTVENVSSEPIEQGTRIRFLPQRGLSIVRVGTSGAVDIDVPPGKSRPPHMDNWADDTPWVIETVKTSGIIIDRTLPGQQAWVHVGVTMNASAPRPYQGPLQVFIEIKGRGGQWRRVHTAEFIY